MKKAQVITLANQKGGVGKSTTCHIMAYGLYQKGYRVLATDLDPQENLTDTFLGAEQDEKMKFDFDRRKNIYYIFRKEFTIKDCLIQIEEGLDFVPGSLELCGADMEFSGLRREYILRSILQEVEYDYDYILIDTPPALGILTINALTATNKVVIPVCAKKYSIQGTGWLMNTIKVVQTYNPDLEIAGILITQYDGRAGIRKQIQKDLRAQMEKLQVRVFENPIRIGCKVEEAQYFSVDLLTSYPNEDITKDYQKFLEEFLGCER